VSGELEIQVQRRNTAAFVMADPLTLVLTPHTRTSTAAGGFRLDEGEPREPQTFRLIPAEDTAPEVSNSNGRMSEPTYTIMGLWNADMDQWDTFSLNGNVYEIASPVRPEHTLAPYERKGYVVIKSG
jgi:hypothetical protein